MIYIQSHVSIRLLKKVHNSLVNYSWCVFAVIMLFDFSNIYKQKCYNAIYFELWVISVSASEKEQPQYKGQKTGFHIVCYSEVLL